MVFGTPTQNRLHSTSVWSISQKTLENVNEYCYLGITLHSSGNFKRAQIIIHRRALHAHHSISKSFSNVENVPIKVMLKLFSSIVIPILLYGCEVRGPYLLGRMDAIEMFKNQILRINSEMEKLHLKFCKRVLGVYSKSTIIAVFGELGWTPLIFQIAKLVIKYWFRIKTPSFSNTLVGEAAKPCMERKPKSAIFLALCNRLRGGRFYFTK